MGTVQRGQSFTGIAMYLSVGIVLSTVFYNLVAAQPQVYFKASLPAKSLPRIGRRSDNSMASAPGTVWYDSSYNHQDHNGPPSDVSGYQYYKEGQGSWQEDSPYNTDDAPYPTASQAQPQYRKFLATSFKLHKK